MRIDALTIAAFVVLVASQLALADLVAFSGDTDKHEPELKVLRESHLGKIELSKNSLLDAVTELNVTLAKKDQPRVNFAIRGAEASNYKIVIRSDDINFAEAFDSACAQAGYTWSVVLNRAIGNITVIATPKKNEEG